MENSTPCTLQTNALSGTTCLIYVPDSAVSTYKTTGNWVNYASRIYSVNTRMTCVYNITSTTTTTDLCMWGN